MSDSSDEVSASSVGIVDDERVEETIAKNPSLIPEKIAQDVMVFKKIAERLPPMSLLHLLKADVLVTVDASGAWVDSVIDAKDQVEKHLREDQTLTKSKMLAPHRASKVCFATNDQGKPLCNILEYEPIRDKSLWWQRDEMDRIREECTEIVENYSLFHQDFEQSIANLMEFANEATMLEMNDDELKYFTENEAVRGLERHVVVEVTTAKQMHFEAIMDAQFRSKESRTTERWKNIKKASLENSLSMRFIAARFALVDRAWVENDTSIPSLAPLPPTSPGSPMRATKSSISSRRGLRNLLQRTMQRRFTAS